MRQLILFQKYSSYTENSTHDKKSMLSVYNLDTFSDIFLYTPFCVAPHLSPRLVISSVMLAIISETTDIIAPAIIVANHNSRLDTLFLTICCRYNYLIASILLQPQIIFKK
jgi:hypothetical protein